MDVQVKTVQYLFDDSTLTARCCVLSTVQCSIRVNSRNEDTYFCRKSIIPKWYTMPSPPRITILPLHDAEMVSVMIGIVSKLETFNSIETRSKSG